MNEKSIKRDDRVAIVTGGTKNIGLSICRKLLNKNIKIAMIGSNQESIDTALQNFDDMQHQDGDLIGFVSDLVEPNNIKDLVLDVYKKFGRIDVIINSAGILDLSSVEETTIETWNKIISVNLSAPFFLVQNSLPYLKKSNAPRIINISSNAGRMGGYANGMSYTSSKGGLISLTYGLARQLAKWNITVNCIAPGTIESDMLTARDELVINNLLEKFPLNRFGTSDEVAEAVMYFVDIKSGFTTGAVLDVNGGLFTG